MTLADTVTRLVWSYGRVIAALLVLLGAAALVGAGVTAFDPGTETVVRQTDNQSISTEVRTSAVVTGNTTLYEPGERLSGKSVYLRSAAPVATYTVVTSVPADHPVEVTHRLAVVVEATRDGSAFYADERTILDETHRVTNGTAVASATLDVPALASDLDRTQTEVGTAGTVRVSLVLQVDYRTDAYEGRLAASSPLQVTQRAYWLDRDLADSREHSTPVSREVSVEPDPLVYGGLALLALAALAGAAGVVHWRRGLDGETIEIRLVRAQYDEWISNGEFPTGMDRQYVRVDSLEDLVDIAIDSEKRVVHDERFDADAVVDGDVVYYFTTEPFAVASWLDA